MASMQTILETLLGYPASTLFKNFQDLSVGHKPYRNIFSILMGALGSSLGGVAPTVLAPEVSQYAASIVQAVLPLSGPPSYITANMILVYIGLTTGLVLGKYSAQAYYYARYKDTNSGHILYDFERNHTVRLYKNTGLTKAVLELRVEIIFHYLIAEIRRSKSKNKGTPLEPVTLAWTKEQLKGVLMEFMSGNDDPYVFLHKLAAMKNNFLQIRLQERVTEIERLLVEEVPTATGSPNQAYQRPNSPSFRPPARHQRRATVSETELLKKHPKLHRYVTQVSGDVRLESRPVAQLEVVKTLLLSKASQVRRDTQSVPQPLIEGGLASINSPEPFTRSLRVDV